MKVNSVLFRLFRPDFLACAGLAVLLLQAPDVKAQHHNAPVAKGSKEDDNAPWKHLLTDSLTDEGLINKEIQFIRLTLEPGKTDTTSHRHPCEVFVYVQEGTLEYREGNKKSVLFKKGEILHEKLSSLHTLTKNPSKTERTRLLVILIYTKGKPTYVQEYPGVKKEGK
jgi:quercetin dioxygenase-like cupin family protein